MLLFVMNYIYELYIWTQGNLCYPFVLVVKGGEEQHIFECVFPTIPKGEIIEQGVMKMLSLLSIHWDRKDQDLYRNIQCACDSVCSLDEDHSLWKVAKVVKCKNYQRYQKCQRCKNTKWLFWKDQDELDNFYWW